MTLKVLRILLSEELEMEAGYSEGENCPRAFAS